MKIQLLTMISATLLAQSAFAAIKVDKPQTCPSVAAIHAVGVNRAFIHPVYNWIATNINRFGTDNDWTFVALLDRNVRNEEEAINITNAGLSQLMFDHGPDEGHEGADPQTRYSCSYLSDSDGSVSFAVAITPPSNIADVYGILQRFGSMRVAPLLY